ncbi:MAG: bifunctional phosphoribosyl-AMP cyclohydrolase/phosphoribosyl-ATP diphosphatase HisIE [Actinobacteria bacterium]|nr:bifunctional phosphoribosyl-AMP cyclohydrolase/phosphoribosyl-ATP diphosphatase HisIE [Actinomycetota bacterium]
MKIEDLIARIRFDGHGLVPTITQDINSRQVLMLAYSNVESIKRTAQSGFAWYFSRSRNDFWMKGESSGNVQHVMNISLDCDGDTLLYGVRQEGVACHTGNMTCFDDIKIEIRHDDLDSGDGAAGREEKAAILLRLEEVIKSRKKNMPPGSYTTSLFEKGLGKISKKVTEEADEVVDAAKNRDRDGLKLEIADLLYHVIVMAVARDLELEAVLDELEKRRKG